MQCFGGWGNGERARRFCFEAKGCTAGLTAAEEPDGGNRGW